MCNDYLQKKTNLIDKKRNVHKLTQITVEKHEKQIAHDESQKRKTHKKSISIGKCVIFRVGVFPRYASGNRPNVFTRAGPSPKQSRWPDRLFMTRTRS